MEINYEKEYFHHLLSDKFNNLRLRVERIVCTAIDSNTCRNFNTCSNFNPHGIA